MNDYQVYSTDQTPQTDKWKLPILYKENLIGNTTFWEIGFDGEKYLTISRGTVEGIPVNSTVEIKINTSGRTLQQQALLEARSRYQVKVREGYRQGGEPPPEDKEPMLANEWMSKQRREELAKTQKVKSTIKTIERFPVAVQPKLDGVRMLAKLNKDGVKTRSRNNKIFPHLNHIKEEISLFFTYLPTNSELDGELYSHDINFVNITSIVRTEKKPHKDLLKVKYFIFDIITLENPPYEERYNLLLRAYSKFLEDGHINTSFHIVSCTLCYDDDEILQAHREYVEMGYEGVMVRNLAGNNPSIKEYELSKYRFGRGGNLLKYKEFIDEEGTVESVEEASGTEAGTAILVIRDERDNVFPIRMRGTFSERKRWLSNPSLVIGKKVTFRYQELSPYGIPRFPVGIVLRDYE